MNVFVSDEAEVQRVLMDNGMKCFAISDIETAVAHEGEITVVSIGIKAKEISMSLKSRGVPDIRLNYVDLVSGDDIIKRCLTPKHLYWDDARTLSEIYCDEDFPVYGSGLGFLDKNMQWGWRIPELGIIAGTYSSGKSTLAQMLAAGFVHGAGRDMGAGALLCSWEDIEVEVKRNFALFGKRVGYQEIDRKVSFVMRSPEEDRLVSWFVDLVSYYRNRYGTRFFVLDPWNEMDHIKDVRQAETDYVRDMMKAFRRLVDRLQIILMICTHVPAKTIRGDGSVEAFKIAQSFGSVQFANKADRGICILRTKKFDDNYGHTIIRLDKSKIERKMGRRSTVGLRFSPERFEYEYDANVTSEVKDVWKD